MLTVHIPGLRLVSEANAHEHWRKRSERAKRQKNATAWTVTTMARAADYRPPVYTTPLVVTITRVGSRLMDSDNVVGSAKHVRDAVAAWLGRGRLPHVVAARHELWRRLQGRGWSFSAIACLCDREHSSVAYALGEKKARPPKAEPKGPSPARKVAPAFVGPCATCGGERGSPGDRHCRACRRWREKCQHAGVAPPSAGAAE